MMQFSETLLHLSLSFFLYFYMFFCILWVYLLFVVLLIKEGSFKHINAWIYWSSVLCLNHHMFKCQDFTTLL